jgi:hypothetical protein
MREELGLPGRGSTAFTVLLARGGKAIFAGVAVMG